MFQMGFQHFTCTFALQSCGKLRPPVAQTESNTALSFLHYAQQLLCILKQQLIISLSSLLAFNLAPHFRLSFYPHPLTLIMHQAFFPTILCLTLSPSIHLFIISMTHRHEFSNPPPVPKAHFTTLLFCCAFALFSFIRANP